MSEPQPAATVMIARQRDAGIELFMLQFQPFEAEMRRFAAEIFPRVKAAARVAAA